VKLGVKNFAILWKAAHGRPCFFLQVWMKWHLLAYRKTEGHLLAYSWNRVLLEKPAGSQLDQKFPAFYGTRRRFIPALKSARHLYLSSARSIHSMPPYTEEHFESKKLLWSSPKCFFFRWGSKDKHQQIQGTLEGRQFPPVHNTCFVGFGENCHIFW